MAVFTDLSLPDADRALRAHGLAGAARVVPIPAGSVNSNFFVDSPDGTRLFARIYEEQDTDGVAYEWALLDHLDRAGLPVPRRVGGTEPGAVRVAGKPFALFGVVGGQQSCQQGVTPARAAAVGRMLATVHRRGADFGWRRAGRFTLADVGDRLRRAQREAAVPALGRVLGRLETVLHEVQAALEAELPRGVIHGDLFRDNVQWEGNRIVAVLDWESASDGALVYDLMVTVLAWCYGDALDWGLAAAMVRAYHEARPLGADERDALRHAGLAAAVRFATTRITDFELAEGIGERVHKDYRRFVARLEALYERSDGDVAERLLGG